MLNGNIPVINPTGVAVQQETRVPVNMARPGRTLASLRMKEYLPCERNHKGEIGCDV